MKLKHIIAVTVGAAALCAPSCDLDEKFYSEVTPDTFFTSPESTYAVLCRPFTHWKWYIGADRWYLQELTTDEMVCPKRGSDWYNSGEYYRLHYHTWSPDDRFGGNTYDGTTGGISRALEAKSDLQGVDYNAIGLNDAVKADHIYQLNAITANFYMRGLDYFGGMPIYYSVDDDLCARSTARETYAHIETLLKDAIPALSKKTTLGASEDAYIQQAAAGGVIHQQQVGHAVLHPEVLGAAGADGRDQLVGELLTGDIHDDEVGVGALDLGLDGRQQMGLAQARAAVDEQRVVGTGGVGRNSLRRSKRKLVGWAFDEVLEGEFIVALRGGGVRLVLLGQHHLVGRGAGHHQRDVHIKAQHGLDGLHEQAEVAVRHDLADEVVAHREGDMAGVLKADRLQPVDIEIIRRLRHLRLAVALGSL